MLYPILLCSLLYLFAKAGLRGLLTGLLLSAVAFVCGKEISRSTETEGARAKRALRAGLIIILGTPLFFKYGLRLTSLSTTIPMGLSYYALSLCAYLLDVSHKKCEAVSRFPDMAGFSLYAFSLRQGPINLCQELLPQLRAKFSFDGTRVIRGLQRSLFGLMKKLVIADRIGLHVTAILGDENAAGSLILYAMLLYSFQIYADFSGGIDVIMGLSEALGITLPENFNAPLVAKSVTEYWQRWHMTLGRIMEKYLYYPLVLSKQMRTFSKRISSKFLRRVAAAAIANFLVFILVGAWHGTGWNYIVYGLYQAVLTTQAILLAPTYKKWQQALSIRTESLPYRVFQVVRTFVILTFGRYFIRMGTLPDAFALFGRTFRSFRPGALWDGSLLTYEATMPNLIIIFIGLVLLVFIDVKHAGGFCFRDAIAKQPAVLRYAICYLAIFVVLILGIYGPGYDAANYIYGGF